MNELNFEKAMNRLQEIVKLIEDDSLSLDKSIALFEEGVKLSAYCNQQLKEYEQKIQDISNQFENRENNDDETSI